MELLIVTGMSGAGKSQAANALEDMGYYCVDNVPPAIIPAFVDLSERNSANLNKMAIVTDARGGDMFSDISGVLKDFKARNIGYKILFLDSSDEVLIRRYKEHRRKHPLSVRASVTLADAVMKERKLLERIREIADYVVDTSYISNSQLKEKLSGIFLNHANGVMEIQCKSFGFKYGADTEADLVIDVRCLPNPFYVDDLKDKTGMEQEVRDYVMSGSESYDFFNRLTEFIECAVPMYAKEGKSQLIISFGCTGGKHRSVTFAELISRFLSYKGYACSTVHRDVLKR